MKKQVKSAHPTVQLPQTAWTLPEGSRENWSEGEDVMAIVHISKWF